MVQTRKLVYDFNLRFNKVGTSFDADIEPKEVLAILNQALRVVYRDLVDKAEINSSYRESLRPMEEKEVSFPVKKRSDKFDIVDFKEGMFRLTRFRVKASKVGCGEKEIPVTFFQTDDLDNSLRNNFWMPSYAWELAIGDEGSEGYYVWHNNDFKIDSAVGDYYKDHPELHCASIFPERSYIDWNGIKRTKDSNLLLDRNFISDRIVDVAVLIAKSIKSEMRDYEIQLNKILNTEKISL